MIITLNVIPVAWRVYAKRQLVKGKRWREGHTASASGYNAFELQTLTTKVIKTIVV